MDKKVSLRAVIEELVALPDDFVAYLDTQTGSIFSFSDTDLGMADVDNRHLDQCPDWQKEVFLKAKEVLASGDCVALPVGRDIDEMKIVRKFCESVNDAALREELFSLIRGGGAFQRFKDAIRRHGIEQAWYDFEYAELEDVAVDWLEAKGILYLNDVGSKETEGA